jgi:hypothetical protein
MQSEAALARVILSYAELGPKKNISYCQVHLNRLSDRGIFPPKVRIGPNRTGYYEDQVDLFLATRPPVGEAAPVLWPPKAPPKGRGQAAGARSPGRPRGSKVVNGRLVLPDAVSAALAAKEAGDG